MTQRVASRSAAFILTGYLCRGERPGAMRSRLLAEVLVRRVLVEDVAELRAVAEAAELGAQHGAVRAVL